MRRLLYTYLKFISSLAYQGEYLFLERAQMIEAA